ncbi:MAG: alanine racemase [Actinomycetota bacterium]|nr:alanine racemase [Actinomycetota bacterium]
MSFVLRADASRWRAHQQSVVDAVTRASGTAPVPVIKGNGYGFGPGVLSAEASRLDSDTVAVGTIFEVDDVAAGTTGDIVVLEPFQPLDAVAADAWWQLGEKLHAGRVIRTVASVDALRALAAGPGSVRVILEAHTSMHRFGFSESELLEALADEDIRAAMERGRVLVEGLAVHMPIAQPADDVPPPGVRDGSAKAREVMRWAGLWQTKTAVWPGHNAPANTIWVSHLDDDELAVVRSSLGEAVLRLRTGTRLWLGDREALKAIGTVLAVHPLVSGTHVGYRQRSGPKQGTLVVVSGGTSHGVGLAGPSPAASIRQRVTTAGIGALDAAGRAMSPFTWQGKQRWFAEPPHQHVSMVWLPHECVLPQLGDEMTADVRFTTSRFDAVLLDT